MKRLAAISLLLILLFNVGGYQLVIFSMQKTNAVALERKLDKNDYTDSELISIKTKLNMPYYQGSETFERAYGSVRVDGKDYEFVKRRVYNDTLELLCLPDRHKTALNTVETQLAKSIADNHSPDHDKKSVSLRKITIPEFLPLTTISIPYVAKVITSRYNDLSCVKILYGYFAEQEHPPQPALLHS